MLMKILLLSLINDIVIAIAADGDAAAVIDDDVVDREVVVVFVYNLDVGFLILITGTERYMTVQL